MKKQCRTLMIKRMKPFKNLQTIVLLFLSVLLFTGCYPATLAPSEENVRSKQVAPPPGKALVYFYLDYGTHDLIDVAVSLNGYGGRISKYTYMLWEVFPGEYLLAFDSSKDQELEIKCDANQIYYYHNVYKSVFNQKLTQASDATGRAKINELSLVKWFKDVPAPPKTMIASNEEATVDVAEPSEPKKAEGTAPVLAEEAVSTAKQTGHPNADPDRVDEEGLKSTKMTDKTPETDSTVTGKTDSAPTEPAEPEKEPKSTNIVTPVRPTSTPVPFAIRDPKFEPAYKGECNTDATISSVEGDSFGASGHISIRNGKLTLWCYGAKHTWKGRLTYAGHVFDSDSESPLQFMVDQDKGYVYLGGKGTVTLPDGNVISLPIEQTDKSAAARATTEPEEAREETQPAGTIAEGSEPETKDETYLTELITYDQYGRPNNIFLFDLKGLKVEERSFQGVPVAKKELTFSQYNSRQITQEKIIVFGIKGIAHSTDYNAYGKPKNAMWLCLDEKGNVIEDANGKAVLVKPFRAEQRRESEKEYDGAYILNKVTKIYPCKNCVEQTGIKNCRYVW